MKVILPFWSREHYWRVTLRSAPIISAVVLDSWDQEVRIFRWKFLAKAVACRHRLVVRKFVTEAIVEAYRPGGNIVDLGARRPR